jgi:excisionase family DNA binding protein
MTSSQWLSLSEVATLLGVHPSTVRSWADQGHLVAHRTQGGHRRFRREDVDLWIRTTKEQNVPVDLMVQSALRRTRLEISEGHLAGQEWYLKLNSEERDQYRTSGRSLLLGLISFLSDNTGSEAATAEARSLGYEYASRGQRCGLTVVEAVSAFLFFRNILSDAMVRFYEETAISSPQLWSQMVRRMQSFTDDILLTLLDTYQSYQRAQMR